MLKIIPVLILALLICVTSVYAGDMRMTSLTLTYSATQSLVPYARGITYYFMSDITGVCQFNLYGGVRGDSIVFVLTSDAVGGHVMTYNTNMTPTGTQTLVASETSSIEFLYTGWTWKEQWRLDGTAGSPALPTSAQGDILYSSAVDTWSNLTKNATATRYLSNTGVDNNPAWAQIDLTNGVTGALPVANGGTAATDAGTARTNLGLGTISVLDSPLPTANGGAPATDIIELKTYHPYPDGGSNSGILADYYDSTNFKNYIEWTSTSATQDYGIAFVGTIPPNFASFGADALSVEIRSNDKDGNVHLVSMYINANTVDAGIDGASLAPSTNDVWETITDTPTGSYSIGHQFKVIIKMGNDEASNTVHIGRVFLTYATR